MILAFDKDVKRQIGKIVDYANDNIYVLDDVLDMMNGQMTVPGAKTGHLVLVPMGRWICYYLVDHPEHGRCHYFSIKPDASGKLPDRPEMEHILSEFGIQSKLLDKHIKIDKIGMEANITLPIPIRGNR